MFVQQPFTSAFFCLLAFDALVLKTISGFCLRVSLPCLHPLSGVVLKLEKQPMFGGLFLSLLDLPQGRGQGLVPRATAVSLLSGAPHYVPRGQLKEWVQGTSVQDGGAAQQVCLQRHHRKHSALPYDLTALPWLRHLGNANFLTPCPRHTCSLSLAETWLFGA